MQDPVDANPGLEELSIQFLQTAPAANRMQTAECKEDGMRWWPIGNENNLQREKKKKK